MHVAQRSGGPAVHHPESVAAVIPTARGSAVWTDGLFKSGNFERAHPVGITQSLQETHILHERVRAVADSVVLAFDDVLFNLYSGGHIA